MITHPLLGAHVPLLLMALLLLAGVLLSKTSSLLGVPSLLLFLGLGMLAGAEGLLGIPFDDFALAQRVGIVALAFILFSGGTSTSWRQVRGIAVPGLLLATVAVALSALLLGAFAALLLDLPVLHGILLGSVIASTDAAAVFSILRSRGVAIATRLRHLLELESGSNDPAAVFLTVGVIALIQTAASGLGSLAALFVMQMGIGLLTGWLGARALAWTINRLHLEYDGLYPVFTVAFVMLLYEATAGLGGSGFLATYVAGLVLADAEFLHKRSLLRFHDAVAWLMQIAMFVLMGLLVTPSHLLAVAVDATFVAVVLILLARPLAVLLTLAPLRVPWREILFVSWVGLRGATPIILGTFPVVAGIDTGDTIFNVVFFVVLVSVLLQGTTIPVVATRLGLTVPGTAERGYTFDAILAGDEGHRLRELTIPGQAPAVGRPVVNLGLPSGLLLVLLYRGGEAFVPQGRTVLQAGDRLLLLGDNHAFVTARDVLVGPVRESAT